MTRNTLEKDAWLISDVSHAVIQLLIVGVGASTRWEKLLVKKQLKNEVNIAVIVVASATWEVDIFKTAWHSLVR